MDDRVRRHVRPLRANPYRGPPCGVSLRRGHRRGSWRSRPLSSASEERVRDAHELVRELPASAGLTDRKETDKPPRTREHAGRKGFRPAWRRRGARRSSQGSDPRPMRLGGRRGRRGLGHP
ncbi:hypothetical protein QJS66_06535 [Kocuria rhizophila]|nr:hypothetical protein QJS66_06535 [Kocuria rhizophila]